MKKLLITGVTGFVGSRVLRKLVESKYNCIVLLRKSSNTQRINDLLPFCNIVYADLNDHLEIEEVISDLKPTQIIHLAWNGVKNQARNNKIQIENIYDTINLYSVAQIHGCTEFIGLGSQAEYGLLSGKITESAPTFPTTVYGAAKLSCYQLLDRLSAVDGINFCWLRLFSSYGEGDDPSWMLPYLTNELISGRRPSLTLGEQYWDYIHVDDVATGIISAMEKKAKGIFNLGSGKVYQLREIIIMVRNLIDKELTIGFGEIPYRSDQVMHLEADITSLTAVTGWRPTIDLNDGLFRLVESHRKNILPFE